MTADFVKVGHRYMAVLRLDGERTWTCPHGHRSSEVAKECAEQELARRQQAGEA